jgi:8-oxo-dGTP pyrophosphatase MutT (NUDIX family)
MPEASPAPIPATPRLAATVLILRDDPLRVLMVRRTARQNDAFSSALVFPGGVVDPGDRSEAWLDRLDGADGLSAEDRAVRIAGIRETFEEAGIILADRTDPDIIPGAPCASSDKDFMAYCRANMLRLPLQQLIHFAHWITPEANPRRFDTHFFLCRMPPDAEAVCDGQETVSLEWAAPTDLLDRAAAEPGSIPFPTRMNLKRLAESSSVAEALAAAATRTRFTVRPRAERRDGRTVILIPAEAGYGVTEDWRPG